ncbi:putative peptide maturation dehydrogenase [Stenotrophomonas sp. PS02289]|uniref:putative peptide maturation dehydrogenase n=1 Tax=Stenotrophomonas sp. PS02289 TaxID=2991422 RepID=UPI00249B6578|nr:putative peptide maturation dehydrogenase [Stenotrophomonas sp. PS02289]
MKFRRCKVLYLEPRDLAEFQLESLLNGGSGLVYEKSITAIAGHLDNPCRVSEREAMLLLSCSSEVWQEIRDDPDGLGDVVRLIQEGLLICDLPEHAAFARQDEVMRESNWWPLGAVFHRQSRWAGVNSVVEMERHHLITAQDLVRQFGPPPLESSPRQAGAIELPKAAGDGPDALLSSRVTCRNFDSARALPFESLAAVLQQVFMATSQVEPEPGVRFLKKNVPSAGSLHPIEAYVLLQNVTGLEDGLYHYHSVAHELSPVTLQSETTHEFAMRLLSGQHWFANAHVLVLLVCRFERNFWKYRHHSKAYRAVTLDAGHISQAIYTAATQRGLGACITAAINETEVEQILGLTPLLEGPLAVCGFGWRSSRMQTAELDPAGRIWKEES